MTDLTFARRSLLPVLAAALALAAGTLRSQALDWRPLFGGKDLEGWKNVNCAPSTWTVRDNMIVCTGKPTGVLRTEDQYENFILELEWRHMVKKGNAGLFVWSDALTARGQPFTRSIEVQVLDGVNTANYTSHGDIFSIHGATMTPDRPHPNGWSRCLPSERRSKPAGEWNHYKVTCKNGTIKLEVNGKEVSGGYDISPRKGYICLESEGSEVHFRNLKIKELPPAKPALKPALKPGLKPELIAQTDQGYRSLYNGLDLSGFKLAPDQKAHWKAADWRLGSDGKGGALWTEEGYANFSLILDYRPQQAGEAFLYLRGSKTCKVDLGTAKPKYWNRYRITLQGKRVSVELNGRAVDQTTSPGAASLEDMPARGPIGLHPQSAAVQFANLYIKELK